MEESIVERHASAQDSAENNLILRHEESTRSQGRLNGFRSIIEFLTDLIRYDLADTFDISAEAHGVALDIYASQFFKKLIDDTVER